MDKEHIESLKIKEGYSQIGYFFHLANSRSGHNFIRTNIESWTGNRMHINLENKNIDETLNLVEQLPGFDSIYVLNIRSLLNWYSSFFYFAMKWDRSKEYKSRIFLTHEQILKNPSLEFKQGYLILAKGQTKEDYMKDRVRSFSFDSRFGEQFMINQLDKWLVIAREFKGESNHLHQFVKIYYDDFFMSQEYRKEICNKVRGSYNEKKLNYVTKAGEYSSFDRDLYDGKAQRMDVLRRWKNWKPEHTKYLVTLKEHPALEFHLENFDVSIEEKQFIDSI